MKPADPMEPEEVLEVWRERERRAIEQERRSERKNVIIGLGMLLALAALAGIIVLVAKGAH